MRQFRNIIYILLTILGTALATHLIATSVSSRVVGVASGTAPLSISSKFTLGKVPAATTYPNPIYNRDFKAFTVGYDPVYHNPAWVAYKVFPCKSLKAPPRPEGFKSDPEFPDVTTSDYNGTGYDRGHMCPNFAIATRYGVEAQAETFTLTNIAPQKPQLNRHVWERLEMYEAKDIGTRETVYVITGPIYDTDAGSLNKKIKIPTAFFKLIIKPIQHTSTLELKTVSVIIPQTVVGSENYKEYITTLHEIERRTGLNLMPSISH